MVQRVWLVRHGEQVRHRDGALTVRGTQQADAVMQRLRTEPIGRIVISPARRARDSATPLLIDRPALPVRVDDRARERMEYDPPVVDDASWDAFREAWDRTERDRDLVPAVGDSSRAAAARLRHLIDEALPDAGDLVVITHGGIIRDVLRDILSDDEMRSLRPDALAGLPHGSITRLDVVALGYHVGEIGTTEHLPGSLSADPRQ
ncbi:histidine phosphatase family protein [Curtobacterium sp. MCBD17_035]|uniref:histidine phosphatase family protein n=1 Tax=Curtobacterium sp. MCBD17_035 TaxID=2175673 RepID=UPI0015E87D45|nr:histidine phosphatase family protein [Curtobacterium sp. MCBD17_035]WIB68929.1 histidine phosphatase family protein [Curtobacterium sp. MCBD17_035]